MKLQLESAAQQEAKLMAMLEEKDKEIAEVRGNLKKMQQEKMNSVIPPDCRLPQAQGKIKKCERSVGDNAAFKQYIVTAFKNNPSLDKVTNEIVNCFADKY